MKGDLAIGEAAEAIFGRVEAGELTEGGDQIGIAVGRKEQVVVHNFMLACQR